MLRTTNNLLPLQVLKTTNRTMTLVIVTILILGFVLIATEKLTNVNKAAVAIFIGTLGWILYICYGTDYVMSQHAREYAIFADNAVRSSSVVKQFIAQNIFLKYVGKASEVVLFLLATMTIVEILQNNGCFDFISQFLRTRSGKKMLWMLSSITFFISANLDSLTTTVMMLTIMHGIVIRQRQRMLLGCAIVLSANCGGALTVIGDPATLTLWNMGAVTATNFSTSMAIPCLVAWVIPIWWIGRKLPERIETEWISLPYRGNDTLLTIWQRVMMLVVGIGGLWFIPTFHNITKLSPFLGALCVLAILWIVNEVVNRKLLNADQMIQRRIPRVLQYGVIQMILFVLGITLALGVVKETGILQGIADMLIDNKTDLLLAGITTHFISALLDNFTAAITMFSLPDTTLIFSADSTEATTYCAQNGAYWKMMAYAAAVGGNILCTGSVSGLAIMKMEKMRFSWYFRNVGFIAMIASLIGILLLYSF